MTNLTSVDLAYAITEIYVSSGHRQFWASSVGIVRGIVQFWASSLGIVSSGHRSSDLAYWASSVLGIVSSGHRQFWASLIALGIKTVETRSWPAPARLGDDWSRHIPTGAVLATAVLAGMARVAHIGPLTDHAGHDPNTEIGCAVGLARTPMVSMFRLIPGAFQRRRLGVVPRRAGCGSWAI